MMDTTEATKLNAITFKKEMSWVSDKIDQRLDLFFEKGDLEHKKILPPDIVEDKSIYADYITAYCKEEEERFIIAMTLATNFMPELFDRFLIKNKAIGKNFTEFGGSVSDKSGNIFIPTLRTVAFIFIWR